MSHRTQELRPLRGYRHIVRELRYHEASRQILAVVLIALFSFLSAPSALSFYAGAPLIVVGAAWRLYASGFIMKNEQLATSGPYALVRHPLYTGNILIILGFSVCSGIWWTVAMALFFFWAYYPTAIEYEDRKLRRLFGTQWEEWSGSVPALLPSLRNVHAVAGGSWSFLKSAKQNGEPVIFLFVLGCLGYVAWKLT